MKNKLSVILAVIGALTMGSATAESWSPWSNNNNYYNPFSGGSNSFGPFGGGTNFGPFGGMLFILGWLSLLRLAKEP